MADVVGVYLATFLGVHGRSPNPWTLFGPHLPMHNCHLLMKTGLTTRNIPEHNFSWLANLGRKKHPSRIPIIRFFSICLFPYLDTDNPKPEAKIKGCHRHAMLGRSKASCQEAKETTGIQEMQAGYVQLCNQSSKAMQIYQETLSS